MSNRNNLPRHFSKPLVIKKQQKATFIKSGGEVSDKCSTIYDSV